MRKLIWTLLGLLTLWAGSSHAQCGVGEERYENPFGTCACEGHLWFGHNCTDAYYCFDRSGHGCYNACPEGYFVSPSFADNTWECLEAGFNPVKDNNGNDERRINVCPFDEGYNLCTGGDWNPAPTPQGPITSNPLGTCHCDNELWVSEGCSYGYFCDSTEPNGGFYLACPDGESLTIDLSGPTPSWDCTTDTATCPGPQINGIGCPMPACDDFALNPLGTCECDGQFFINEDCTQGFMCMDLVPDQFLHDGCRQLCFPDEILVPHFGEATWECVPRNSSYRCPGHFNLNCPDDNIEDNFTYEDCECDGQLFVNDDCTKGFYCLSRFISGGISMECPAGQVIVPNLIDYDYTCVADVGQCPGLGGFKLGCGTDMIPPMPIDCTADRNHISTCDGCEGQLFMADDCLSAFYCTEHTESIQAEGCRLDCPSGQRVMIDPGNRDWGCVPETADFVCPGEFKVDCDPELNVDCHCHGEVWVNGDCTQGFYCMSEKTDTGVNPGQSLSCPQGQYLNVTLDPPRWHCVDDPNVCLGSFHFGCDAQFEDLECTHNNHLGECGCDGQLFIGPNCDTGFYCNSSIADNLIFDGCRKDCPQGQWLVPRFDEHVWECIEPPAPNALCPGQMHLNCPDDNVGHHFNSSLCECDRQFFISDDCKESFFCLSFRPGGGTHTVCGDGEIVEIDFFEYQPSCQPDVGQCPDMGGFKLGCDSIIPSVPPLSCEFSPNTLGVCEGCEGQIFINEDCTQAFYCSQYVDGSGNDGCLKTCGAGERIEVDLYNRDWECVPRESNFICPGEFKVDCDPTFEVECGCTNEYWVSRDCAHGFRCAGPQDENGHQTGTVLSCPPGQFLDIDFTNPQYRCTSMDECPGAFHFGCVGGDISHTNPPTNPPTAEPPTTLEPLDGCQAASSNSLGTCSCEGQYFISDNCRDSFLCTAAVENPDTNIGCRLNCNADQRVEFDFSKEVWECVDLEDDFYCPGAFSTDCLESFEVECRCSNEIWVSDDCNQAFHCSEAIDSSSLENHGNFLRCPAGQIFEVDLIGGLDLNCVNDQGQCPGSYHFGCEGGDFGNIPPESTTTTTTTTTTTAGQTVITSLSVATLILMAFLGRLM